MCCKHRAMLRHVLAMLDPEPPTPAAPAAALAPVAAPKVECPACDGIGCAGYDEDDDGRYWPAGRCKRCGGEGGIPSPLAASASGSPSDLDVELRTASIAA